jgi:hypothetical protein
MTGLLEGDPKALKAEDGVLRGDALKDSLLGASFCGNVGNGGPV